MKPLQLFFVVLAVMASTSALFGGTAPRASREGSFQEEDFRAVLRRLMTDGPKEEIVKLVQTRPDDAAQAVLHICEAIAERPDEHLEREIAALRVAWKEGLKTSFVSKMYEYFSLLRTEYKDQRKKVMQRYLQNYRSLTEAGARQTVEEWNRLADEFEMCAQGFESVGDHYMASQSWAQFATCCDDGRRGKASADYVSACAGWGKDLEARRKCDLLDAHYSEAKQRYELLLSQGFGEAKDAGGTGGGEGAGGAGGEPKPAGPAQPAPAAAAASLATTFEIVPDIEAIRRPIYSGDVNYATWQSVGLKEKGTTTQFETIKGGGLPNVVRVAEAKAGLDVDADGTVDVEIPLTGNITPIRCTLGEGESAREWAFLAVIGQQQDTYQGFRFNLAPAKEQMTIYVAPAGSIVATIGATRVQILDDNLDGKYGSKPLQWGFIGCADGFFDNTMDSIVIGEETSARPWSELQEIGGAWYELKPDKHGARIAASPKPVETGTLKLDWKGPRLDFCVVRGSGALENCFFDLAPAGKKGVAIPAGTYSLYFGQVSEGKKNQLMKAMFTATKQTPTWTVKAGGEATVELGAPFGFAFGYNQDDTALTVIGPSVVVTGRGEEAYQRFWNCVPHPEVNGRPAGSKRGDKLERMRSAESQEEVSDLGDYRSAWFPINVTIEKKKEGETLEVQLFEKKNKLFGEISSVWR